MTVLATKFVHVLYPCYFFETLANVYNTAFAMSCRVMHYMVISLFIGTIFYLSATYYFQNVLELGFDGIVYATGIMLVTRGIIAVGCVKFGGRFETFPDVYLFSRETIANPGPLINLDLKSTAMSIWSFWGFELYTIMASYLGIDDVAGQVILRGLGLMTFMIPIGIQFGTSILVGNSLGEGRPQVALQYFRNGVYFALFVAITQITYLYRWKEEVITFFTDQLVVARITSLAWPVFLVFILFDTLQVVTAAVMRATMQMGIGSILNITGYFLMGIPIAWYFAFHKEMGVKGIWCGPAFACMYLLVGYNIVISRINW